MADDMRVDHAKLAERLAGVITDAVRDIEGRIATDPEAYLDLVSMAAEAEHQTEEMLHSAVSAARSAGHSWEAIGARLNVSRQAAQKRFGRGAEDGATQAGAASGGDVRVVSGLTVFNEMKALERLGRHGWHSIAYGPFHHVLRRSDRQWEHLRLLASSPAADVLLSEGWQQIGDGWFPWVYLKRQLDAPAVPESMS
jgi:hypothetical protein